MTPIDRRSFLTRGAASVLAVGGGTLGLAAVRSYLAGDGRTHTQASRSRTHRRSISRIRSGAPLVGLTFDDGPDPKYTPNVLAILERFGVTATFFCVGVNLAAHPDLARSVVAAGHGLGNHSLTHRELDLLDAVDVRSEIDGWQREADSLGIPPATLFRPPKGFTSQTVIAASEAAGCHTVFWEACVEDFIKERDIEDGIARLLDRIEPGSIVLAHDGGHIEAPDRPRIDRSRTIDALPILLDGLGSRALTGVDIETLLAAAG